MQPNSDWIVHVCHSPGHSEEEPPVMIHVGAQDIHSADETLDISPVEIALRGMFPGRGILIGSEDSDTCIYETPEVPADGGSFDAYRLSDKAHRQIQKWREGLGFRPGEYRMWESTLD